MSHNASFFRKKAAAGEVAGIKMEEGGLLLYTIESLGHERFAIDHGGTADCE